MAKIIGGIIVAVLLVGGIFVWQGEKAAAPTPPESQPMTETEEKGGVIASIKDAMGLGQAMQCTYALNEGDMAPDATSTVLVEGEKFKSTTVMKDMTVYALFDGENQYTWSSKDKQGMKMSKACLEKMTDTVKDMVPSTPSSAQAQDIREGFEMAKNVRCEAASNVDLSVPADITFTDQCAMMEQSLKMMEQLKQQMPTDIPQSVKPNVAY